MLANFLDGLILALIEDDLVLFEQVATLSVDGNDQGAKLVNMAVPQSFRHTEVTPLGLDDLLHLGGSHNENERAAYMEKLLEDGINSIGLGPQGMGGKYSVMGVHIENTARHPSAIGVAVNVGCWSHRRGHIIFDKDLNYTIDTHSGVTL